MMQKALCTRGFRDVGVAGGLVALLDFKSSGGPQKSTVGSIPIYSRQKLVVKDERVLASRL